MKTLSLTIKTVKQSKACITLLLTGLIATAVNQAKAQTLGFTQQDIIKKAGVYTDLDMDGLAVGGRQTTRIYYNGFGQTLQTVAEKASPLAMDIIQPYAYDNLGRQTTTYLPYVGTDGTGSYRPNALASEQAAFYGNGLSDKVADDSAPYSTVQVELSPLQRLLSSGAVGNGFQPGQHAAIQNYRSNNSSDGNIIIWGPTGSNLGNYTASTLTVTEVTDADNVKIATFTDIAGRTVLKRQYTATAGSYLDTYYVYNNAGMVSYVIPPKALALMVANANYSLSQAGVANIIFHYLYDMRGRLAQKYVPGMAGAITIIYDPMNRPVLVQNPVMATSYKWYYIKYDVKGHAISQGIYVDPNHYSATVMQTQVNSNTAFYETRNNVTGTGYYTNTAFPTTGITPLAYSYFDNYDMDSDGTDEYSYSTQTGFTATQGIQTPDKIKGVPTMTRKTTMANNTASGTWLVSYTFYDRYGRAIQTQSNNLITAAVSDVKTSALDFTGAPLQTKVIKVTGSTTTSVLTTIGYDPSHRINTIDQSYNGATTIRVATYVYNELGQMIDKKLHSTNGGSTYMQSVDYRYNIRGQLLSINNSKLTSDTGTGSGYTNDDSNDLFGMQFLYDQVDPNVVNKPYYNGKLSAVKWMSKDASGTPGYERSFKYAYDAMDRYTTATYAERTTTGTGLFNNNIGGFNENITYDVGGCIATLGRNSATGVNSHIQIDTLTYSYDSSTYWLYKVTDGTDANHTGAGFRNLANSGNYSYSHDLNGNQTIDPNKGLILAYNDLNKTDKITITTATNRYITYTYDGTGTLIRKQSYDNGVPQTTTDYIDGFVYLTTSTGTLLSYFPMPEGRVRNTSTTGVTLKPEYIINDQQGNARISFEESTTTPGMAVVRQENSYYPSGEIMPGSLVAFPAGNTDNKQLYNGGSEWQNDFSNLPDYYETFYRNYDAALMQFIAVDPEPESAESMTTYQYANNNPVVHNDPMGNFVVPHGDGTAENFLDGGMSHAQMMQAMEYGTDNSALFGYWDMRPGGSGGGNALDDGRSDPTSNSWDKAMRYLAFMDAARSGDPDAVEAYARKNGTTYKWNQFAGGNITEAEWVALGGKPATIDRSKGASFSPGGWVVDANQGGSDGKFGYDPSFKNGQTSGTPVLQYQPYPLLQGYQVGFKYSIEKTNGVSKISASDPIVTLRGNKFGSAGFEMIAPPTVTIAGSEIQYRIQGQVNWGFSAAGINLGFAINTNIDVSYSTKTGSYFINEYTP